MGKKSDKDQVDQLFEDMFGFSVSDEPAVRVPAPAPVVEDPIDIDQLLSVPHKPAEVVEPPKPSESPAGSPLDAAKAVQEAVRAHTGKRRSVDSWKDIAREVMQLGRLTDKRWTDVLDVGVKAGLFRIDTESLSYAHIIVTEQAKPEPVKVIEEPVVQNVLYDWPPPKEIILDPALPCGHVDFTRRTQEENEAAQAEGFCCAFSQTYKGFAREYHLMEEPYLTMFPVPARMRKDHSKTGWPGLCADENGKYIGGLYNDCRYHTVGDDYGTPHWHPKDQWCAACRAHFSASEPKSRES